MNIFYLDHDPHTAATYHCDKHVVKMIVESAQLLSTAHHILDGERARPGIYKATHANHPSAVWVRSSLLHYDWVYRLLGSLCMEYTIRYGKTHKTKRQVFPRLLLAPKFIRPDVKFAPPPMCMPEKYWKPDTVKAYRDYYVGEKYKIARYTNRPAPCWFENKAVCK